MKAGVIDSWTLGQNSSTPSTIDQVWTHTGSRIKPHKKLKNAPSLLWFMKKDWIMTSWGFCLPLVANRNSKGSWLLLVAISYRLYNHNGTFNFTIAIPNVEIQSKCSKKSQEHGRNRWLEVIKLCLLPSECNPRVWTHGSTFQGWGKHHIQHLQKAISIQVKTSNKAPDLIDHFLVHACIVQQ